MPSLRPAQFDDARAIAAIHVAAWRVAYASLMPEAVIAAHTVEHREVMWHGLLRNPVWHVYVAEDDETMLGWVAFGPSRDIDADRWTGEVTGLYLHPKAWRQGIGRQLWDAAVSRLMDERYRQLSVWVLARNTRARRFYEAMGCVRDRRGRKLFQQDGCRLMEFRYTRDLPTELPPDATGPPCD